MNKKYILISCLIVVFGLFFSNGLARAQEIPGETWIMRPEIASGRGTWSAIAISSDGQYQTISRSLSGYMYTSSDYGENWIQRDKLSVTDKGITMSSDGKYQTVISGQYLYTSSNYGATWTQRITPGNGFSYVTMSSNGQYQTAVKSTVRDVYTSSNYGVTWTLRQSLSGTIYDVDMSSDGKYQIVTYGNRGIYTSSNYGGTWTSRKETSGSIPSGYVANTAMSSDGKYQTMVSNSGNVIYSSSNYGVSWSDKEVDSGDWYDIIMSADGRYRLAGKESDSSIYVSSNYGVTWTATGIPGGKMAMSSNGQYQTVGKRYNASNNYLYTSSDYGVNWEQREAGSTSAAGWTAIAMSSDGEYQTAAIYGYIWTSPAPSNPEISVTPSSISFGNIIIGETSAVPFTIENTGTGTLTGSVTGLAAPFSCVSGCSYNLTEGQQQSVLIRFTPTSVGSFSDTVEFSGAAGSNNSVSGSGIAVPTPAISVTPSSINFGDVTIGSSSGLLFTVQNIGTGTLTGSVTGLVAPFSCISGCSYNLTAGQTTTTTIRFTPTSAGTFTDTAIFSIAGGTSLNRNVSGVGVSAGGISVWASCPGVTQSYGCSQNWPYTMGYNFIPQKNGQITQLCGYFNGTKTVRLFNSSYSVLATASVTSSDNWSCSPITPINVVSGSVYYVVVNLDGSGGCYMASPGLPRACGDIHVNTSIYQSPSGTFNSSHVEYSSTMYGVADIVFVPTPAISVTPASRDFGSVTIGSTSDLTFTVENTGSGTLTGSVTGLVAPFSCISGCSYNLTAGQTATTTIRFTPTSAVTSSDTAVFSGAAGASRNVSGTGASDGETETILIPALSTYYEYNNGSQCFPWQWYANIDYGSSSSDDSGEMTFNLSSVPASNSVISAKICAYRSSITGAAINYIEKLSSSTCNSNPGISSVPADIGSASISNSVGWKCIPINPNEVEKGTNFYIEWWGQDLNGASSPYTEFYGPARSLIDCGFNPSGATDCRPYIEIEHTSDELNPQISVTPPSIDFGDVNIGEISAMPFTVENIGTGTLSGSATGLASPFLCVSGCDYNLNAGQQQSVLIRFTPTSAGSFSDTIGFSGGSGSSNDVSGSGVAVPSPQILIAPSFLNFNDITIGDTSDLSFSVANIGVGTLSGSVTGLVAPFSCVSGCDYNLTAGQQQSVLIRFTPTSVGSFSDTVEFSGAGGSNNSVSGSGVAVPSPQISITPNFLNFGDITVGSTSDRSFTTENTGTGTLTGSVTGLAAPFSCVSGCSYNLIVGQTATTTIRFTPTSAGSFSDTVEFSGGGDSSNSLMGNGISSGTGTGVWQSCETGSLVCNIAYDYTMGYKFTPQEDGRISQLCGHFTGTKTVKLYNSSYGVMASANVTASDNWVCENITPVSVTSGTSYYVGTYLGNSGACYRLNVSPSFPNACSDVMIDYSFYQPSNAFNSVHNFQQNVMYGMVDVVFSSTPVIVCNNDVECDDSNPCTTDVCNLPGQPGSSCSNTNVADGTDCGNCQECQSGSCDSTCAGTESSCDCVGNTCVDCSDAYGEACGYSGVCNCDADEKPVWSCGATGCECACQFDAVCNLTPCADHDIWGYAWTGEATAREGLGWISLSCKNENGPEDYGIDIEADGNLTGYAYFDMSDLNNEAGWIDFDPDLTGRPTTPAFTARIDLDGSTCGQAGKICGWARVVGNNRDSSWDGWLKVGKYPWTGAVDYGWSIDSSVTPSEITGYAWAGQVVSGASSVWNWVSIDAKTNYKIVMPPTTSDLRIEGSIDYCTSIQRRGYVTLSWLYEGGLDQEEYELQVSRWSNFPALPNTTSITDTQSVPDGSRGTTGLAIIPSAVLANSELNYNTRYYFRVRAKDTNDRWSDWSNAMNFQTDQHAYPYVGFDWDPLSPAIEETVAMNNTSICYNFWNNPTNCHSYNWTIPASASFVDSTNRLSQDPHIQFTETGDNTVELSVRDLQGFICTKEDVVGIKLPFPDWIEINPED